MKNNYYEYLKSLDKDKLIRMIYTPKNKPINFEKVSERTIAIRISYEGKNYSGTALQINKNTVAGNIINALNITGIGGNLVFAGRTDTGVSAINMIASLKVISRVSSPNFTYSLCQDDYNEYRYDLILNNYLPKDIRITGWAPVPESFSARFTCIQRQYRYYFCNDCLDLEEMKKAVKIIGGMTNFYDLCKHSDNARYNRNIDECEIVEEGDICYLSIKARGFLHNMVRKIMWVVFKAGRGQGFSLERVGIADPDPLVFCGAKYPTTLEFIGNHLDEKLFKENWKRKKIEYTIAELRYNNYSKDI